MIRHLPCLALVVACVGPVLAAPAFADESRLLSALDSNQDGSLSRAEFLVLRAQMFSRIDTDASGTVTKAETEAARAAMAQQADRRQSDIWAQDADGDGQLTLAEYTSVTPGFDRADRDGDGTLSGPEIDRLLRLIGSFTGTTD